VTLCLEGKCSIHLSYGTVITSSLSTSPMPERSRAHSFQSACHTNFRIMKLSLSWWIFFLLAISLNAAVARVDVYTAKDLKSITHGVPSKGGQFASKELAHYSGHYTMLAHREQTGSSEVHQHEADIFVVEEGQASLLTGGILVNSKMSKAGEWRGSSIQGGERHSLSTGDIVHIPAGVPHQLLIDKGKPFTYFVIKVAGQ
jgi:mannose-6-phosphate isomerase-like protein (cupin superfamily)